MLSKLFFCQIESNVPLQLCSFVLLVESKPLTGSADNPQVGVILGPVAAVVAILIVVAAVILYRKRVK